MKKYMNVLCVLILALMLFDLVYSLFFTRSTQEITLELDSFSLGGLLCLLALALAVLFGIIYCFVCFIKFILNVNRNEVFTSKNISLLRKYGVSALLVGVCVIILSVALNFAFDEAVTDGIDAMGEGFFALLMGEVFGIGLNLKEGKS